MFSRVNRRNTEESQTPVAPQVQGDSSSSTETQASGVKWQKWNCRYWRSTTSFELEGHDLGNSWVLPSVEATYVHKYIAVHISPKDIKEKILSVIPVPSNIKNAKNLMNTSKSY